MAMATSLDSEFLITNENKTYKSFPKSKVHSAFKRFIEKRYALSDDRSLIREHFSFRVELHHLSYRWPIHTLGLVGCARESVERFIRIWRIHFVYFFHFSIFHSLDTKSNYATYWIECMCLVRLNSAIHKSTNVLAFPRVGVSMQLKIDNEVAIARIPTVSDSISIEASKSPQNSKIYFRTRLDSINLIDIGQLNCNTHMHIDEKCVPLRGAISRLHSIQLKRKWNATWSSANNKQIYCFFQN